MAQVYDEPGDGRADKGEVSPIDLVSVSDQQMLFDNAVRRRQRVPVYVVRVLGNQGRRYAVG